MQTIVVKNINKSYEEAKALNNISFSVEKGELFGIIGPDGAGKTTLFRILTTLILPDTGTATIEGLDVVKDYKKIRTQVGYMPGKFSLYQDLTVEENLQFFATVFHTTIKNNYNLIKDIYSQIEPFKTRKAGKLSGGMKQKLAIISAWIHEPKLIIMDEPFVGLDPKAAHILKQMMREICDEGGAIFFSTHVLEVAEKLCDKVAIIRNGQLIQSGTMQEVKGDDSLEEVFLELEGE